MFVGEWAAAGAGEILVPDIDFLKDYKWWNASDELEIAGLGEDADLMVVTR